jgi:mono/diheme cytochrome c family protein
VKRALILAMLMLAACNPAEQKQAEAPAGPPGIPPMPLYQMRDAIPAGDRLAAGRDGAALFSNRCGACHLDMGMGTNLITKQMMAAKRPPSDGLLANRTDLTSDYVKSVVRMGKNAMPRLSRVEVTDAELDSIANYLGKADQ